MFFLSSISFPRIISAAADWMSTILPYMVWRPSAYLECMFEMCCTYAARWKYRIQKYRHFGTIAQICRAISSELRQGGHHVGHWPTFLVATSYYVTSCARHIYNIYYKLTWTMADDRNRWRTELACVAGLTSWIWLPIVITIKTTLLAQKCAFLPPSL